MGKRKFSSTVSMKDVARLAGVSPMTVSRALHDPETVRPETRRHVNAVIDAIGYVPNRIAGNLSSDRTTQVALIVPSLSNALYSEMIHGISSVLQPQGYQLMISDSGYSLEQEEQQISAYIAHRVCGIILHNTQHTDRARRALQSAGIPCVETGTLVRNPVDMLVSYSNYRAGMAMAEHLVGLGYRRIGFATLKTRHNVRLQERRKGFLAGIRQAGLDINPAQIVETGTGLQSGGAALAQILAADPRVQAIFFAGDILAAGAIFECQRRGIRIPDDIAIAASDDNDLMQNIIPSISTVRFPRFEIGRKSAELIIARTQGKTTGPVRIDVGFEVIRRSST